MSDQKQRRRPRNVKAGGSAGSSAKRKPRGRPFEKGNPYRWKEGQSGNPAGSSRKQLLSEAYLEVLSHPMPANLKDHIAQMIADGAPVADIIAWAMAAGAIKGNTPSATEMRKATEGNTLKSELTGKDGSQLFPNPNAIDLSKLSAEELEQFTANVRVALDKDDHAEAFDA